MQATTEWKRRHIWTILATVQPNSFGLGISAPPPCFQDLFGKVQQCCISPDQTTGDLKSHHLQAGVAAQYVPPPPPFHLFYQQYKKKNVFFFCFVFKGNHGLLGGHVPLRPPLGPALPPIPSTMYLNADICDIIESYSLLFESVYH